MRCGARLRVQLVTAELGAVLAQEELLAAREVREPREARRLDPGLREERGARPLLLLGVSQTRLHAAQASIAMADPGVHFRAFHRDVLNVRQAACTAATDGRQLGRALGLLSCALR